MIKITNGGSVFNLVCGIVDKDVGLIKEWEKVVYVPKNDVEKFVQKYNMKNRGGLLYIAEFVQLNKRRPQFAEVWSDLPTVQQSQRKTAKKMSGSEQEADVRVTKRVRRTRAQIEADNAKLLTTVKTAKRVRRTRAQIEANNATNTPNDDDRRKKVSLRFNRRAQDQNTQQHTSH